MPSSSGDRPWTPRFLRRPEALGTSTPSPESSPLQSGHCRPLVPGLELNPQEGQRAGLWATCSR